MKRTLTLLLLALVLPLGAQRYTNPILHLDFSDPDVCRVGEDYYMTASSFNCFPGLPVLHSVDLVHWEQIGAALWDYPGQNWDASSEDDFHWKVQHGNGVWAPAIRYHEGWFYIFVGDPDRGIFMVRTQNPAGPWEPPVWVVREKGFIDPCPFWDEGGSAWLSHGCAGSRAGVKSVLFVAPMAPDGTHLLAPSRIVYDGHLSQPTIEGTKLYKREGWYYIFSPAGGVATGWQTVLRSKDLYGPWEERVVMAWAPGTINGPHQGGWVTDAAGKDWFIYFQDKGAYGRIVHLQPMTWRADGWPVIGEDPDGDGVGQPVASWKCPEILRSAQNDSEGHAQNDSKGHAQNDRSGLVQHNSKGHAQNDSKGHAQNDSKGLVQQDGRSVSCHSEERSDEESVAASPYGLPLEWQFPAVPSAYWSMALPGGVRLFSVEQLEKGLWNCPNLLLQKFPAERFTVSACLSFRPNPALKGEEAGFVVMGNDYAALRLTDTAEGARLEYLTCQGANKGGADQVQPITLLPYRYLELPHGYESKNVPLVHYPDFPEVKIWVKLEVTPRPVEGNVPDAVCTFSWSRDGKRYTAVKEEFIAKPELWIGAKFGFWCNRYSHKNDGGCLDILGLRVE